MARHDQGSPSTETVMLPRIGHVEQESVVTAAHAAGEMAVQYAGLATEHAGTPLEASFREQAAMHTSEMEARAYEVRQSFRQIDSEWADELEGYMGGLASRVYSGRHYKAHGKPEIIPWTEWLGYCAADDEVLEFMAAHRTALMEQVMEPEVASTIERVRSDYLEGIRTMVAGERMSRHALRAIAKLRHTKVLIGDIWDTVLRGYGGYHYEGGANEVVLAQHIEGKRWTTDKIESIHEVLPHELGHVEFGHSMPSWLNEGINEYMRLSMRNGEYERVAPYDSQNPDSRQDTGSYEAERSLLATLLQKGGKRISTALATRAFTSEGIDSAEYQEFSDALDEAWGLQDVLGIVTRQVDERAGQLQAEDNRMNHLHAQAWAVTEIDQAYQRRAVANRRAGTWQ